MFEQRDFKRRFPRGFGEPITRAKATTPHGVLIIHHGGPVDLRNPESTRQEVNSLLGISPYEEATITDVYTRAEEDVEGIIYDKDKTFRYFVWLTAGRKLSHKRTNGHKTNGNRVVPETNGNSAHDPYTHRENGNDDDGIETESSSDDADADVEVELRIRKIPFLVWFGSSASFLSLDTTRHFFNNIEMKRCREFPLMVDGEPFFFRAPDERSNFSHYNILGRDFLESRFNAVDADYTNLKVLLKRRNMIKPMTSEPTPTPEWVRERDEDLERYLEDEDDDDDDGDDDCDDNSYVGVGIDSGSGIRERVVLGRGDENLEMNIDPRLLVVDTELLSNKREQREKQKGLKERPKKVDVDNEGEDTEMEDYDVNHNVTNRPRSHGNDDCYRVRERTQA
ncbi:hypothetical protein H072_9594 [Dactylellina haptotyla CBS 200.50]|uniref:Uncharacterized protein n=1 Tax=Dactylellina haptotyla (strain CBS 200.50) TaxID=1284197 RepID=S8BNC1_DACHA|nr:hypothetical protein H072_9594 [Dactylellina haptotyla CBS 200.50]